MKRVGYFDDHAVLPSVGNEGTRLALNVELFYCKASNLFLLQQRAPAVPCRAEGWASRLAEWAKKSEFKLVLLLSTLPAELRLDNKLVEGAVQLTVQCAAPDRTGAKRVEALGWDSVGASDDDGARSPEEVMAREQVRAEASVTSQAMLAAAAATGLDLVVLMAWCSEGDNVQDGMQMAGWVNDFLELLPSAELPKWRAPSSWRLLLENNAPREIFN